MTAFIISCLLVACNATTDPTPTEEPILYAGAMLYDKTSPFLNGDTIIIKKNAVLSTAPKTTNVKNLQKDANTPLRYVAIGGSLSAGVRDFGLYRAGQQTAFPNLLAIQMGIKDFKQPLFTETEYNGYGYRTLSTKFQLPGSILPRYNIVKNNLAVVDYKSPTNYKLNPHEGEIDNLGLPFAVQFSLNYKQSLSENSFLNRFNVLNGGSINQYLLTKNFDFISVEGDIEDILIYAKSNGGSFLGQADPFSDADQIALLKKIKERNIKAVYLNIPNVLELPYFNIYSYEKIREGTKGKKLYISNGTGGFLTIGDGQGSYFYPKSSIDTLSNPLISDNLKRGLTEQQPLRLGNVLFQNKVERIDNFTNSQNGYYLSKSKELGFAYVDLNTLYKKIIAGGYITDDGVRVDATFIKGNFFSNDGLYPTAFGQAVITNEIIRTLNSIYKTEIPFIKTAEYLKK